MFQVFPDIPTTDYPKRLENLLSKHREIIQQITAHQTHTYDNTISRLQELDEELEVFFTPLSHLNSTLNDESTQQAYDNCIAMITLFQSQVIQNTKLYQAIKATNPDTQEQQALKELLLQEWRHSGAELDTDDKQTLETIDLQLAKLGSQFANNLLHATNQYEMIITDPADIEGMPQDELDAALIERDGKQMYRFTLQMPSYIAYMTHGPNRQKRAELYQAYTTRAPSNSAIIDQILTLRDQKATLMGYHSYADYALQMRDAQNIDDVTILLGELLESAKPQARADIDELKQFAKKLDHIELQPYDVSYYSDKLKKAKYDYDDSLTKPYFAMPHVLDGTLDMIAELFDLQISPVDTAIWHPSVHTYDIMEAGERIARIYFDLESRPQKRGGAWMHDWESHFVDTDGRIHSPSAFVVANFAPATSDTPSLLRHDDIVTLFHEIGHALHHLLSKQSQRGISGINGIAWDVVEFPSQFLENFAYLTPILRRLGKHYQSGETIPDELIHKIQETKNFHAAIGILRQVEFALFDIKLHQGVYQADAIQKLLDDIRRETALLPVPRYNKFQHSFSHIFAGGYAAGYYSYKWAEVFSAEALFACIDDSGDIIPAMIDGYKTHILSNGSSKPMRELLRQWLGIKPSARSLAKLYGIASGK